ncbi:hypothetical protein ACFW3D_23715 [Streptomyces sp. NPDC058864]
MNVEQVVRETLHEMSAVEGARVPGDFAEQVLRVRRARRVRKVAAVAMATAAVLVAALLVSALDSDGAERKLPSRLSDADIVTDLNHTPPLHQVAAGDTALSAYYTLGWGSEHDSVNPIVRTWYLLNTSTGRYEKTPWAYIDVAPGLKTAAVLEGPLPAKRVGLVDMSTGKVTRWIGLGHGAGGLSWSPQGDKLAVTTYVAKRTAEGENWKSTDPGGSDVPFYWTLRGRFWGIERTGYYVVRLAGGTSAWRSYPVSKGAHESPFADRTEDAQWTHDGSLIMLRDAEKRRIVRFYDARGRQRPGPAGESPRLFGLGLSPDGRLTGDPVMPLRPTKVLDVRTGKTAGTQMTEELLAWADNHRVLAWETYRKGCSEGQFCQRLVVVDIDGKHLKPLTTSRTPRPGQAWEPVFTRR